MQVIPRLRKPFGLMSALASRISCCGDPLICAADGQHHMTRLNVGTHQVKPRHSALLRRARASHPSKGCCTFGGVLS
jgi:hypothetical protein